jgi:hypothetical protein
MTEEITLAERGREIRFTYGDMLRFHGHGSPGGVAHAFKMLQRALPLLDPARATRSSWRPGRSPTDASSSIRRSPAPSADGRLSASSSAWPIATGR